MGQAPTYRSDIDGLRAVSILLVLASHVGIDRLVGGFVGVDVFFVISGYLITSLIAKEVGAGSFSLVRFYERRVRRILPALILVLLATTLAAWILLYAEPFEAYAESLLSTVLSASNIYFWLHSGYFDPSSESLPLRHTWSLGVEEQFYIVFPLIILSLHTHSRRWMLVAIAFIGLASFAYSCWGAFHQPTATFYLLPTRAWELMVGGGLAFAPVLTLRRWLREIATGLGLIAIFASAVLLKAATPFPGLAALPACAGAALVIAGGSAGSSLCQQVLSVPPARFVGKISYSLYLWHWPLIVLAKDYFNLQDLTHIQEAGIVLAALILSVLSWRFVETPFRSKSMPGRRVVLGALIGSTLLAISAVLIIALKGAPSRFSPAVQRDIGFLAYDPVGPYREGVCFLAAGTGRAHFDRAACLRMSQVRPNVLLFGDSHAAHLWPGLVAAMPQANLMQATASLCKPRTEPRPAEDAQCRELDAYILDDFLQANRVDLVILSVRWEPADLPDLAEVIDRIKGTGAHVLLVGPSVEYNAPLPKLLAQSLQRHDPSLPGRERRLERQALDQTLARLAADKGVEYRSMHRALCTGDVCRQTDDQGDPLQWDYGHLTAEGSRLAVARMTLPAP